MMSDRHAPVDHAIPGHLHATTGSDTGAADRRPHARDWADAGKVTGYIARAREIRVKRPASKNCPRPVNTYALMNWGHNPDK